MASTFKEYSTKNYRMEFVSSLLVPDIDLFQILPLPVEFC